MAQLLKVATNATLYVGPVLDVDGVPYTSCVIADFKISVNGAAAVAFISTGTAATATSDTNGYYVITTGVVTGVRDTDYVGTFDVVLHKAGYVMPLKSYMVVPANVFDAVVSGTDYLQVDTIQWIGTAPLALSSQQVQSVVPTTQKVDVETIKTKSVTVDSGGTTFPASIPSAATVADAVFDETATGHTDAGKAGAQIWTDIDAILVDTAEIGAAGAGLTAIGDARMPPTGSKISTYGTGTPPQ